MKFVIKSREGLEKQALEPFFTETAIISITNFDDKEVKLANKPIALLRLSFDDVDGDVFIDELG